MRRRNVNQRGGAYVEFVLVGAFLLVPLILGLLSIGFTLSRSLHAAQLTRDVGRMFVRGVDFSEAANQELLVGSTSRPDLPKLAQGLGMAQTVGGATGSAAGNGVLVFSILTRMASTCNCSNAGHIVLTRRVVVGNNTLLASAYGSPEASLVNAQSGAVTDYANQVSARANAFSSVIDLAESELAYLVESRFNFPDLALPGVLEHPGVSWRVVF
ncbi:MAG: hypothetical protein IT159_13625 [Bryobacterales bacterium]|nr:hypothetical protein [Bryobacterales bacterium]